MTQWKGIVGRGFTAAQFEDYVRTLTFNAWRPQFTVVHNTGDPRFDEWHSVPADRRLRGLESYYRDDMKWSGGPHLFVADDLIWTFTPLTVPGVHSPSWNSISWGVEIVGDYDHEELRPDVWQNAVSALSTLHMAAGLNPDSLRLHKEDPRTTHSYCPGARIDKQRLIDAIHANVTLESGEHLPSRSIRLPAKPRRRAGGDEARA